VFAALTNASCSVCNLGGITTEVGGGATGGGLTTGGVTTGGFTTVGGLTTDVTGGLTVGVLGLIASLTILPNLS